MAVSKKEFARLAGVSPAAVRKAIRNGRIATNDAGEIEDAETALQEFMANRDLSKVRTPGLALPTPARKGEPKGGNPKGEPTGEPKGEPAAPVPADMAGLSADELADMEGVSGKMAQKFMALKTRKLAKDTDLADVKLRKERFELLDRAAVIAAVHDQGEIVRKHVTGFADRFGLALAQELAVPPRLLMAALERDLRTMLEEIADNPLRLPEE